MVDPINATSPVYFQTNQGAEPPAFKPNPAKEDLHSAEEEVTSLYYLTTLKSLAADQQSPEKNLAVQASEKKAVEKSFLGKAKDWLWGIFGWGQKQPIAEVQPGNVENSEDNVISDTFDGAPKLEAPEDNDNRRLSQAIADLNRELINRLKDMAEFEEEMRKSSSGKLDKLIFLQLVSSSINQKKLKETSSILAHEDLLGLHKENKGLQKAHFALIDEIISHNKARTVLKWINVGLTAVTVGGSAIGFALGGPLGIVAVGVPLSLIGKGSTMLTDGILKYKNDARTGDLLIVKQESKINSSRMSDKLSERQISDGDIAALLKMIRHHLDNQSKAERASFGRN